MQLAAAVVFGQASRSQILTRKILVFLCSIGKHEDTVASRLLDLYPRQGLGSICQALTASKKKGTSQRAKRLMDGRRVLIKSLRELVISERTSHFALRNMTWRT
jgi:hypothetical protein